MKEQSHILIIDDTPSTIKILHDLLKDSYRISVATTGKKGLELVSRNVPDLILLDIMMPGMDGYEVCRCLKKDQVTRDIPILFITAKSKVEEETLGLELGAADYITKPISPSVVQARIRNQLVLKKQQDQLMESISIMKHEAEILREKENFHRTLESVFKNVNDALITINPELLVTNSNVAAKKICCFNPDDLLGNKLTEENTADCLCLRTLLETMRTGKPVRDYRVECVRNDNEKKTVILTSSILQDNQNQPMGGLLVIRDVTRLTDLELQVKKQNKFHDIIGKSSRMQEIFELLKVLSDTDTTVLIRGDSGTGKEMVARALHYQGERGSKPMVTVNCSALAEELLESELFGHVKGSFTGAVKDKTGRFEIANGGTVFLDEIGDISPRTQLKLLRFLQEREFEKVGDTKPIKVDVRIIAATNRDLQKKIQLEEFRQDLYYRLKVVEINLPKLSERSEDIPLLTEHFIRTFNNKFGKNIEGVADSVMKLFMEYSWPGNVRELEHTLEHAFVICKSDIISPEDLPTEFKELEKNQLQNDRKPNDLKADEILRILNNCGWNKSKAAKKLGISRPTLYAKIEEFNIVEPTT